MSKVPPRVNAPPFNSAYIIGCLQAVTTSVCTEAGHCHQLPSTGCPVGRTRSSRCTVCGVLVSTESRVSRVSSVLPKMGFTDIAAFNDDKHIRILSSYRPRTFPCCSSVDESTMETICIRYRPTEGRCRFVIAGLFIPASPRRRGAQANSSLSRRALLEGIIVGTHPSSRHTFRGTYRPPRLGSVLSL